MGGKTRTNRPPVAPAGLGRAPAASDAHAGVPPGVAELRAAAAAGESSGVWPKSDCAAVPAAADPVAVNGPALFTEESAARLVRIPFRVAAIRTDFDGWDLDDRETAEIAPAAAAVLNESVKVNPKWVAMTLLGISLAGIVAEKSARWAGERKVRKAAGEPETTRPTAPPPPQTTSQAQAPQIGGYSRT